MAAFCRKIFAYGRILPHHLRSEIDLLRKNNVSNGMKLTPIDAGD